MTLQEAIQNQKFDEIAKAIFDATELEGNMYLDRDNYFNDECNVGDDRQLLEDVEKDQAIEKIDQRIDVIFCNIEEDELVLSNCDIVDITNSIVKAMKEKRHIHSFEQNELTVIYSVK